MVAQTKSAASRDTDAQPALKPGAMKRLGLSLFGTPWNAFLSLVIIYVLYRVTGPVVEWTILDATWRGASRDDCLGDGACWAFIVQRFGQFMYGFYPEAERWRPNLTFVMLALGVAVLIIQSVPGKRWVGAFMLLVFPFIALGLLYGGLFGLVIIPSDKWGGLLLTLVFGVTGIVASLPIGIILALGRRSEFPVIRLLCIGFIEFWRGVPLIAILFMTVLLLPLFLPSWFPYNELALSIVGITFYAGAYIAEVVRGGLQSIPKGQFDAAASMGLGYWQSTALIVLPQALRVAIPGIVNTAISVFKDSTLVMIIGLFDILNIVAAGSSDEIWLGTSAEGYIFVAAVFWVFCFGFSQYSRSVENRLKKGRTL